MASAGKCSNNQAGNILRLSSMICAILASSTVKLPESDLKKATKPAPAKASKLTIITTSMATAHNFDTLLGLLFENLLASMGVMMCTNSKTNKPANTAGNK